MSHAKIYQISTKPISRDYYVEPDDFYDNSSEFADYIGEEVEGEERGECIANLVKYDLQELFDLDGDTLVYKGKPALWAFKKKWVDAIREKAQAVKVYNVTQHTPRATLRDIANGTHKDCADRFVIEEWSGRFAEPMAELVCFLDSHMRKGQRLYIGAVIDFHY